MKINGTVLVADRNKGLLTALVLLLQKEFSNVITEIEHDKIVQIAKEKSVDIIVLDTDNYSVSGQQEHLNLIREINGLGLNIQIVTLTNFGQNSFAMETVNSGAFDFIIKPWNNEKLLVTLKNAYRMRQYISALNQIEALKESFKSENPFYWGISDSTKGIFEAAQKFSQSDEPVLLSGEKGCGKELLAQQIHNLSGRGKSMFIKMDGGSLLEGEFERKISMADGGTVYIENIESLSVSEQKLLIKVLKNKIFSSLQYSSSINANIRLIAGSYSSHSNLLSSGNIDNELIGLFKKNYMKVPSLNERKEDIIPLATVFLNKYCRKYGKEIEGFSELAKEILLEYKWVGNTSELSLAIERAVILTPHKGIIQPGFLLLSTLSDDASAQSINTLTIEQMEKKMMRAALKKNKGNITLAADQLGITRQTLYNKGKKYNLFK